MQNRYTDYYPDGDITISFYLMKSLVNKYGSIENALKVFFEGDVISWFKIDDGRGLIPWAIKGKREQEAISLLQILHLNCNSLPTPEAVGMRLFLHINTHTLARFSIWEPHGSCNLYEMTEPVPLKDDFIRKVEQRAEETWKKSFNEDEMFEESRTNQINNNNDEDPISVENKILIQNNYFGENKKEVPEKDKIIKNQTLPENKWPDEKRQNYSEKEKRNGLMNFALRNQIPYFNDRGKKYVRDGLGWKKVPDETRFENPTFTAISKKL